MKKISFTILALLLILLFGFAQNNTLYILKNGEVVGEYNTETGVDSIIFYRYDILDVRTEWPSEIPTPDTMYIMKNGIIIGEYHVKNEMDSMIFYEPEIIPITSFTDTRDGNNYKVVTIGNQIWMAENLKYLPEVVGPATGSETTPYYYVYGYDGTNVSEAKTKQNHQVYGTLYNWSAALDACPKGWHLPTKEEWDQLVNFCGGEEVAGGKLRESGTAHWASPYAGSTDEYGFTALPGGMRNPVFDDLFFDLGSGGSWWSATEQYPSSSGAWAYGTYNDDAMFFGSVSYKDWGSAVRCIKNEGNPSSTYILTLQKNLFNGGNVTGGGNYKSGTTVNITATATEGFSFENWTGDTQYIANATSSSTTVTMPAKNISLTANFKEDENGEDYEETTKKEFPKVTTKPVTDIEPSGAKSGGEVISEGGSPVEIRGVRFGEQPDLTDNYNYTVNGSGLGSYSSSLYGLKPNTTYYVCAYAGSAEGYSFGETLSFKTKKALPVVTTAAVSDITAYTATCGGEVTYDGDTTIVARGVVWSTYHNSTLIEDETTDGSGLGAFTSSITGLEPGTNYSVRAYATNAEGGTSYGARVAFKTLAVAPEVSTLSLSGGTVSSIVCTWKPIHNGGEAISMSGVCWSLDPKPTIEKDSIISYSGDSYFEKKSYVRNLTADTTYYIRAFAKNSAGVGYGKTLTFKTKKYGSFKDIRDETTYQTVEIGSQIWMAENLKYLPDIHRYNNSSTENARYYVYDYGDYSYEDLIISVSEAKTKENYQVFGALYNWPAAKTACPAGWHLPTEAEWTQLEDHLVGWESYSEEGWQAIKLKEAGDTHWYSDIPYLGNNESGFTALPGGRHYYHFVNMWGTAWFWTATPDGSEGALGRELDYDHPHVRKHTANRNCGYSVRCIKD